MTPLLSALAARCDQTGAVTDLAYFLSKPGLLTRRPVLLLFVRDGVELQGSLLPGDVSGAAILYESEIAGIPTGMYSSNDRSGQSSLLAPAHRRAELAAAAGRHLLGTGAHVVLFSFRSDTAASPDPTVGAAAGPRALWAIRQRSIPDFLHLKPTFDETLAGIGQRTRSNLRYYRRRAENELGCTFHPTLEMSTQELLDLNHRCMYPVSDGVAAWRHRALEDLQHPLLMGIKDRDGCWLSIVGARRVGSHSEILWQMNRAGLPSHSLSLVMRSYLIEHEIQHGATRFYVEGGSPHPIRHSFVSSAVTDFAVLRRSVPALLTRKLARHLVDGENELGSMLYDPDVRWNSSPRGLTEAFPHRPRPTTPGSASLGWTRIP